MSADGQRVSRCLYMFTLLPPEPIRSAIRALQEEMAQRYGSQEALRRPVHITLIPPFDAPRDREAELADFTRTFAAGIERFVVKISGFGEFRERVIFVRPEEDPALMQMQKLLSESFHRSFAELLSRPSHGDFHPHFTIGYRDLTHDNFRRAWAVFEHRAFDRSFRADSVVLMRHDGSWVEVARGEFR